MSDSRKRQFVLGLAQKAGKLVSGDFAVKNAFKEGRVKILFVARDAAAGSRKELHFLAEKAGVPVDESLTADEIGSSIGKGSRISAALLDENFLNMLR
ncbi:MAG: ribosomal L7Ae/L30e/S12e/Gadd45 family protein [Acidaminococcaceae bacterium]|nr:ribosomal L7Ae/L30e/S12e/Gadd45 family protein [Acidaminococcaceae bacterium]